MRVPVKWTILKYNIVFLIYGNYGRNTDTRMETLSQKIELYRPKYGCKIIIIYSENDIKQNADVIALIFLSSASRYKIKIRNTNFGVRGVTLKRMNLIWKIWLMQILRKKKIYLN